MRILLLILTALALLRAAQTMADGRRLYRRIRAAREESAGGFAPVAAVLAPYRGVEPDMDAALRSLLTQAYPDYEIIFVFESPDDPAAEAVRRLIAAPDFHSTAIRTELVFAGRCTACGQKVHNLKVALQHISPDVEVYAFVDSDIRVKPGWLHRLVAPLEDDTAGAATGYRLYLPERGGLASGLLSAWNTTILSVLVHPTMGFAWGGSMALRRKTFEEIRVLDHWAGAVSDDYGVTRAVRNAGLSIRFAPRCLTLSRQDMSWAQLWEFVCRQYTITRVYAPTLWGLGLLMNTMTAIALSMSPITGIVAGDSLLLTGGTVLWIASMLAGHQRFGLAGLPLPDRAEAHRKAWIAYVFGAPLLPLFNALTLVRAGLSRRIVWRGITYRLLSADRVEIEGRTEG